MTAQELISSGKLELYVAGVLSGREMEEVAALAMEFPEVALEIEKIEQVMVAFLSQEEFQLPEKEQAEQIDIILSKIRVEPSGAFTMGASRVKVLPIRRYTQLAMAALIAGLVLTTCLAAWMGIRYMHLSQDMRAMKTDEQNLASSNNQFQDKMGHMQQQVDLMRNILTKRVQLGTVAGNKITSQDNYMLVYWNPGTRKLLLVDAHLPALSATQQYQLWALYNGQPIDAGVFDLNNLQVRSSFQKDIPNAQAFAVTVEPKGGSKAPTMGNLCMYGKL